MLCYVMFLMNLSISTSSVYTPTQVSANPPLNGRSGLMGGCRPYGHTKMVLWPQSYGGQPRAGTPLTLFHLPADD